MVRLASSLILTRLLSPGAYGIFTILFSILFVVELLSDVGSIGLLIRHPRGNDVAFVHTIWTIRFIRSGINAGIVFATAPLIASIYQVPALTSAFRLLSVWFLLVGLESLAFPLAVRDQRARIGNYIELACTLIMTIAVILLARHLRNHYALIYGALIQRSLLTLASHFFYKDVGVGFAFDREAVRQQLHFASFVLPSSLLTILLSQYDKVMLGKLFNLQVLGVYGLASNIIAPINGIIMHNARVVLYPRCTGYFRSDPTTARIRYYAENHRLFLIGMLLPAIVGGFAPLFISLMYDVRYELAGTVLMISGLGAIFIAIQNAAENLLVASGKTRATLMGNVIRASTLIPATLGGYYFFGFTGFVWASCLANIPLVAYFFRQQQSLGLLDLPTEVRRLFLSIVVFVVAASIGHFMLRHLPGNVLHLGLKPH
jgi:O-antigen/teichoic acid export membrane protein